MDRSGWQGDVRLITLVTIVCYAGEQGSRELGIGVDGSRGNWESRNVKNIRNRWPATAVVRAECSTKTGNSYVDTAA
jgi:hypothetical protein